MTENGKTREYAAPGSDLWLERKDAMFDKIRSDIERVGWSAIGVMDGIPFTYTIGLTESFDHPELIVYGLDPEIAHGILFAAVHWIKEMRERDIELCYKAGERYDTVIEGYVAEFREHPTRPLNMAAAYYEVEELPVLQLLWPDKEGRFPGEEGMNPEYEERQRPQSE